jgi:hypothetical protein
MGKLRNYCAQSSQLIGAICGPVLARKPTGDIAVFPAERTPTQSLVLQ